MSHTGVDVIDFLFYTIYPVIGIFIVEGISRCSQSFLNGQNYGHKSW